MQYLTNGVFKFAINIAAKLKHTKLKSFLQLSENLLESQELYSVLQKEEALEVQFTQKRIYTNFYYFKIITKKLKTFVFISAED